MLRAHLASKTRQAQLLRARHVAEWERRLKITTFSEERLLMGTLR